MKKLWLLCVLLLAALAFAQALPGQANGRVSRRASVSPTVQGATAAPSTPATGSTAWDFLPDAGWSQFPMRVDSFLGNVPVGVLDQFASSANTWEVQCWRMPGYNGSTATYNTTAYLGTSWSSFGSWSSSSIVGRIWWVQSAQAGGANAVGSLIEPFGGPWRGNTAGAGGFVWWMRAGIHTATANSKWFFGLQTAGSGFTSAEPTDLANTAYFGCKNFNSPDQNLNICSNDNVGQATCADLGTNFPCRSNDAVYDFWLAAAPNGSTILWAIQRLDVTFVADGVLSSDLPQNTVQLRWMAETNSADGGGTGSVGYFHGTCVAIGL